MGQHAEDAGRVFEKIDQMIFEFHGVDWNLALALDVVLKLKKHFHVAHFHINNFSCERGNEPFAGWAYEVTFVNKRLATVDSCREGHAAQPARHAEQPEPRPDCQVPPGPLR